MSDSSRSRRFATQRGYNLVEVLVAIAMVGVVTLSVITLFFVARGNVYSGKQMTTATAIGTQAMEDLSNLTLQGVYDAFKVTTATSPAVGTYTIEGVTYTNVLLRSTDASVIASPPADLTQEFVPSTGQGLLTAWRALASTRLSNGSVTVVLFPQQPNTPVLLANGNARAALLRVRVIVRWNEARRRRTAVFDTFKTQR
jgi:prepilin-type N-terminal cleavage/methylation domain-containing protein